MGRIGGGDLAFQRGRDQDLALGLPELLGADGFGAEALDGAVVRHVLDQRRHVQAGRVEQRGLVVLHRDDLGAGLMEQLGGDAADIAEALHDDARALDFQAQIARGLDADHEHAAAGRLAAAQRAAQRDRLAGDDAGRRAALVHRIGVHHPRHHLFVGVDVRRRDVLVRSDDDVDFAGIAARHAFELGARQLARVDADAALGAAVRHVDGRVLDRHPGRQRHHLGQRHVLVEAHAALARAARGVVLHAVALEVGDGAVIHLDRHVDHQRALGALQRFDPAGQRAQVGRHAVDLLQVDAPGTEIVGVQIGGDGMRGGGDDRRFGRHHGNPEMEWRQA